MNYFEFFDLSPAPTVDQAELKKRFYQKSKAFHPDFHTLASPEERERVLEMSSLNNLAYKTLSNDDQRLRYFLETKGALAPDEKQELPQAFLLEIMEINEKLMELEFDDDPELRRQTRAEVETMEKELNAAARPALDRYQEGDDLEPLRDYYLKQRYMGRIKEKL